MDTSPYSDQPLMAIQGIGCVLTLYPQALVIERTDLVAALLAVFIPRERVVRLDEIREVQLLDGANDMAEFVLIKAQGRPVAAQFVGDQRPKLHELIGELQALRGKHETTHYHEELHPTP